MRGATAHSLSVLCGQGGASAGGGGQQRVGRQSLPAPPEHPRVCGGKVTAGATGANMMAVAKGAKEVEGMSQWVWGK